MAVNARQRRAPPQHQRPTHFTRSSSAVAAAATGGGDGSGPNVQQRDAHDIFNLFALLPLIVLTLLNYDWVFIRKSLTVWSEASPDVLEIGWTDDWWWHYWLVTITYFVVDLLWIVRIPTCVKSPEVIIKHHAVAIFYLLGPVLFPEYRWAMGACLSVEMNTWFLIARRVAYLRVGRRVGFAARMLTETINFLFYTSWLLIRCFLYPLIMAVYLHKCQEALDKTGTLKHWPILFVPIHFVFCLLNLRWSWDLFSPILTKFFHRRNDNNYGVKMEGL